MTVIFHGERQGNYMNNIEYINEIIPIVKRAGRKISNNLRFKREIYEKGFSNYVTDLDKSVENYIITNILNLYPNEFFISEEDIHHTNRSSYWVLDPIDGTSNLIHNYKSVCISLAHIVNNVTVFGVVYCLSTRELFFSKKDEGAFIITGTKQTKINVSHSQSLNGSYIGFGCPYNKSKIDYLFSLLKPLLFKCDDIKRVGPASLDICYVACGRLDAYLELDLEIWDFSAGALILQESGGKLTDFSGMYFPNRKSNILASNGLIHDDILDTISKIESN